MRLGAVGLHVVEFPGLVPESDEFPAAHAHGAVAAQVPAECLVALPLPAFQNWQEAPALEGRTFLPMNSVGYSIPATSRQVAMKSMRWPTWWVIVPRFLITAGQRAMSGVAMPPS